MTTLSEFYDMLDEHDWFFEYSDDHKVWLRGHSNLMKLRTISNQSRAHGELFEAFFVYKFGGSDKGFGMPPAPKPPRPKEGL